MSSGFGASMAQYYMSNMSASDFANFSSQANSVSPYTAAINLVGDIFGVIGNAYAAKAQAQRVKYQYEMQAQQAQFQADIGRLNAEIAAYEGTRNQIAFAQKAALTGFQAAQAMANTRVQQSHSGVRMDSTSSQQVRANQQFSRAVDMATTEQNRIELLNASQQQVTNYLTSANMAQASANAANSAAAAVSPSSAFGSSLVTGLLGVAHNEATGMFKTFQNNLQKIDLLNQQKASGYVDNTLSTQGSSIYGYGVNSNAPYNGADNLGLGLGSGMIA